jgi:hypothetical protein
MTILVCGGRDYYDRATVYQTLDQLHQSTPITKLVHGDARGADSLGAAWAKLRGIDVVAVPADWAANKKAAGPMRNALMLRLHHPDLVVAFPGGNGTRDMIIRSQKAGVPVMEL